MYWNESEKSRSAHFRLNGDWDRQRLEWINEFLYSARAFNIKKYMLIHQNFWIFEHKREKFDFKIFSSIKFIMSSSEKQGFIIKIIALIWLTIQNSSLTLLLRYSRVSFFLIIENVFLAKKCDWHVLSNCCCFFQWNSQIFNIIFTCSLWVGKRQQVLNLKHNFTC